MMNRTVVIRKNTSGWQPKIKRKIDQQPTEKRKAGFISPVFIVVAFALISGLFYLYSINQSAIKGFQIREVEKEISAIKKDNERLKIKEAQLKSLYHIEQSTKDLDMSDLKDVNYIDESAAVAFGKAKGN